MRVLHVSSEVAPFAQSGGLADVVAGLPAAQASHGQTAGVVVPMYRGVPQRLAVAGLALDAGLPLALEVGPHRFAAALRTTTVGHVRYGFIECDPLFDRAGGLYGPDGASEFADNHLRFATLGKAALAAGPALVGGVPDVLHVHDWQGAPAALYARIARFDAPRAIVTTIHNLAYRGIFPKTAMVELGLPWELFDPQHVEFWDQVCLLKGGMASADAVTTVSPTYAQEILTVERGEGLDGFLRWDLKRLVGIVNGIDATAWNPASDPALPARFSSDALDGKRICRAALAAELGLPLEDGEVLIGVIARLTSQKGIDLVAEVVPRLAALRARMVVLGAGEPAFEQQFQTIARDHAGRVAVTIGFDTALARRIYGGSDLFVMPSRFEPCGLGQLYAMRYGSIPIVTPVGGLRDTVIDPGDRELSRGHGTGIRLDEISGDGLARAIERGARLIRDARVESVVRTAAMRRDSSWTASANEYLQLYRSLKPW
ncbi:MAG: glycogen synthase GlgA [Kofleriaceae bacterium]